LMRCFHAYKSVAPLKPRQGEQLFWRVNPSFHAYKSVAPLKRQLERDLRALLDGFHAYKSVAPLKLNMNSRLANLHYCFHAYKSVAPLKRDSEIAAALQAGGFPRLQKRGPIEAMFRLSTSARHALVSTLTKAWPH